MALFIWYFFRENDNFINFQSLITNCNLDMQTLFEANLNVNEATRDEITEIW